jgi:hypothetical protein
VAGNDDHRYVRVFILDDIEKVQAIKFRPLQPDIQDDESWSSSIFQR